VEAPEFKTCLGMNLELPHCKVAEAAAYLRVTERYVAQLMVQAERPVEGKIRFQKLGESRLVRLISADVHALLPNPDTLQLA
jgi:hypothetical protein